MSTMTTRWVVGCDGSKGAEHALEWCLANARGRATAVHVVQAWHHPTLVGAGMMVLPEVDVEPETAHPDPDRLAARFGEIGVDLTTQVEYGLTADVLLQASADADLLVLGTRGLGGFARLVVGSVSHQCATHARTPVAIVPSSAPLRGDIERVVVGMDRSAGACAALRWATEFAPASATIEVVGAWQPSSWGVSLDLYMQAADFDAAHASFDAIMDDVEASRPDRSFERHFVGGHPADALLDTADGADLVVVGERGQRGLKAALLGSTTTEVLHRAETTIVIVPSPTDES
ncbi:MAG: universal stress protein [Ilumatobacter sp.]|uniref:universal stress protein n=1 Tax=Ilumatobacter sp. TaxID=1967498 RepID=UPI00329A6598